MSSEKSKSRMSLKTVMLISAVLTVVLLVVIFHLARVLPGVEVPPISSPEGLAPPEPPIWLPIIVVFVGMLCVAGSMAFVLSYLRSKARGAEEVLERLRRGEFSARLSSGVLDDLGGMTPRFNEMAAEIESLVTRLRIAERSRIEIIQDIGHDLRHPLASIRVLAETLEGRAQELTTAQTAEIRELLHRETLEIEDMLEDLLTLASLEDPKLTLDFGEFELVSEVEEFLERFRTVDSTKQFVLELSSQVDRKFRLITDRRLFFRMLRNAVENARRFAKTKVTIRILSTDSSGGIRMDILDDGAGFSSKAQEWFLRRERHSAIPSLATGRGAGLGLGSFVMRKIADLLKVRLAVENSMTDGKITGGMLILSFQTTENKSV